MKKSILVMITLMVMSLPVIVNAQVSSNFVSGDKKEKRYVSPKKEFERAYKEGKLSFFGYNYLIRCWKRNLPSEDPIFCIELAQFLDSISIGVKFVPKLEQEFIKDSLIIGDPYPLFKKAKKMKKISKVEYINMEALYREHFCDIVCMKIFVKKYKEIQKIVEEESLGKI
jgi:hypothetical protein